MEFDHPDFEKIASEAVAWQENEKNKRSLERRINDYSNELLTSKSVIHKMSTVAVRSTYPVVFKFEKSTAAVKLEDNVKVRLTPSYFQKLDGINLKLFASNNRIIDLYTIRSNGVTRYDGAVVENIEELRSINKMIGIMDKNLERREIPAAQL